MVHVGQRPPNGTTVIAKVGSGLANPKLLDWSSVVIPPNHNVVVILGTNDGQNIRGHRCGTAEWTVAYRSRVAELMGKATRGRMLWLLPGRTGRTALDLNLMYVRQAIRSEALVHKVDILDLQVILEEEWVHNPKYHSKDKIHLNERGVERVRAAINQWLSTN